MADKKTDRKGSPLPMNADDLTPSANITYNNEVVAIIAGLAANEVEGIAGMCSVSGSLMGKNRNITKGVKVEVGTEEVAVDLYVAVDYGTPIKRAAADAQENVRKAIESMTGLHVVRVDVHVQSVSFEQEKKALQAGAQNAALAAGSTDAAEEPAPESAKEPAKEEKKSESAEKKAKPAEPAPKASEVRPAEAKPAETKAEAKPAEAKTADKTVPKKQPAKKPAAVKKAKPEKTEQKDGQA